MKCRWPKKLHSTFKIYDYGWLVGWLFWAMILTLICLVGISLLPILDHHLTQYQVYHMSRYPFGRTFTSLYHPEEVQIKHQVRILYHTSQMKNQTIMLRPTISYDFYFSYRGFLLFWRTFTLFC